MADVQVTHTSWGGLGLDAGEKYRPPLPSRAVDATPSARIQTTRIAESDFTPPTKSSPGTASSAALRAFLNAKGDEPLQPSDLRVIETLTEGLRKESRPTGGWSAGTHASEHNEQNMTPRRSLAGGSVSTPGSVFSLGSAPLPPKSGAGAARKVTYLGPGMSSRRLYGKPRVPFKPLFNFDAPKDQMAGKKRKTDVPDVEVVDLDEEQASGDKGKSKESSPSGSSDSPGLSAAASVAAAFNASARRPSPLSRTMVPSPERDFVKEGKKRTADTLQELYESDIAPMEPSKPQILFNPYEASAPSLPSEPLNSSIRRSASGMRMSLRSSTPSRGAAKEIERLKGSTRKLTTLEMVSGFKPTASTASATPEREEREEVEELFATPQATPGPSKAAPAVSDVAQEAPKSIPVIKPSMIEEPEPFKPLPTPSLSSSTLRSSRAKPDTPKSFTAPETSVTDSILSSAKPKPAPVFKPEPVKLAPPTSEINVPSNVPAAPAIRSPSNSFNPAAIFLSAKDSALDIEKSALPFFTFTMPIVRPGPSDVVKEEARKRPREEFTFVGQKSSLPLSRLTPPTKTAPLLQSTPEVPEPSAPSKSAAADASWTCDLCMLKNPASATEKCTICEAPKPGAKAAAPSGPPAPPSVPSGAFSFGAKPAAPAPKLIADGEWTCDTCMLKNPGSASEKCTICEAPKPGAKAAAPSGPPAPPSVPSGGFSFGAKPPSTSAPKLITDGDWTCDTCMLKNPGSAKEKCTICEAPKPGAKAATPSGPPAPPSVPSGGFSFGAKPAAPAAPAAKSGSEWTCDTCMLKNPASATEKCTICEAPRPGATPAAPAGPPAAPSVPSGGFGGFSFGAKPAAPSAAPAGGDSWTCDTCMLKNPASATEKCTICEAPKPGAKAAAPSGPPAPPAGGFSFGASSGGPPAPPSGGFSFGGKPVSAPSTSSGSGGFTPTGLPTPPAGGFSFGAKATQPSFEKPKGEGTWTCSTCMLQNPASATEQCTICEAKR